MPWTKEINHAFGHQYPLIIRRDRSETYHTSSRVDGKNLGILCLIYLGNSEGVIGEVDRNNRRRPGELVESNEVRWSTKVNDILYRDRRGYARRRRGYNCKQDSKSDIDNSRDSAHQCPPSEGVRTCVRSASSIVILFISHAGCGTRGKTTIHACAAIRKGWAAILNTLLRFEIRKVQNGT